MTRNQMILAEIAAGYSYRKTARRLGLTLGVVAGVGTRSKKPKRPRAKREAYYETNLVETWAERKARLAAERAAI